MATPLFKSLEDLKVHNRAVRESRRSAELFKGLNRESMHMPTLRADEIRGLNDAAARAKVPENLGRLRTQRAARAAKQLADAGAKRIVSSSGTAASARLGGALAATRTLANAPMKLVEGALRAPGVGLAASFAAEGVKSAATQGAKMMDDVTATGGFTPEGWRNLMSAEGLKDIGKGLAGSVMDVASGLTFGALPNGDRVRETMSAHQMQPELAAPQAPKSTFGGTVAGDIARRAGTKANDAHATLSLVADGAPADVVGADVGRTAREGTVAAGRANYWTQVEAANKANADYADGVISKETRDELVARADRAKGDTSGQADMQQTASAAQDALKPPEPPKGPNEALADRRNEGADQKTKDAFGYQPYMDQTRQPPESRDTSASGWLATFKSLTSPTTQETPGSKSSDITGTATADVYRRQQQELAAKPVESFTDSSAESIVRSTLQDLGSMPKEQQANLLADNQQGRTEDEKEDQTAAKGGEEDRFAMSRNFLATDRVPDSIFGYPIVSHREDYTPEDIEFFRKHPEAGGYYDLGEGSPEDGTEEGAPVQDDEPRRNRVPEAVSKDLMDFPAFRQAVEEQRAYQAELYRKEMADRHLSWDAISDEEWERRKNARRKVLARFNPSGGFIGKSNEELFWETVPGANSAIPAVREHARANLLPEEREMLGHARLGDQVALTAASMPGMMTYGAAAQRIGNYPLFRQMLKDREMPLKYFTRDMLSRKDLLEIKNATGYEPGVFGPGVETSADVALSPETRARLFATMDYFDAGPEYLNRALIDRASGRISDQTFGDVVRGVTGKAKDLLTIPDDVWKAYPRIGDVNVHIVPHARWKQWQSRAPAEEKGLQSTFIGTSSSKGHTVMVEGPRPGEPIGEFMRRAKETIVHEFEHEGQKYGRRYTRGASDEQYSTRRGYINDATEMDARETGYRRALSPEERKTSLREDTLLEKEGRSHQSAIIDGNDDTFDLEAFFHSARTTPHEVHQASKGGKARGAYPGASNNPGNVEKHERRKNKTLFAGEIGGGVRPKRFANFNDPVSGLNAAAEVLARRARELEGSGKRFTIANYAPIYAPETENDTEGYIKNLSRYSGISRDAVLDLHEDETLAKLLKTVVRFESGVPHSEWFTDEEYKNAARRMAEGAYE